MIPDFTDNNKDQKKNEEDQKDQEDKDYKEYLQEKEYKRLILLEPVALVTLRSLLVTDFLEPKTIG